LLRILPNRRFWILILADRDLASCTERLISISSVDLSDAQRNDASAPHE
jgi:hypothetical protein